MNTISLEGNSSRFVKELRMYTFYKVEKKILLGLALCVTIAPPPTWAASPAGLDSVGAITAPVSGDTSNSSVLTTNGTISRSLSKRFNDSWLNVREYCGDINIGNQSGDAACIQDAINSVPAHRGLEMSGDIVWPGNWTPDTSAKTLDYIQFDGWVMNPPGINDPLSNSGSLNVVPDTLTFDLGNNYDGFRPRYSRSNVYIDRSYTPMMSFDQTNAGISSNPQGSEVVRITATATQTSTGNMDGLRTYLRSSGRNYAGSFDVNTWSSTQSYGTNWVWDHITEMANAVPFYCPPTASGHANVCPAYDMNELDMNITGYEAPESAYDPSKASRGIFGTGGGYSAVNIDNGTHVAWKANTLYYQYQQIVVKDSSNKPHLFYALSNKTTTGDTVTRPITGSISGSILTVTDNKNATISKGQYIYNSHILTPVSITGQLTGTTGGNGTYTVSDESATTTNLTIASGDIELASQSPWAISGSTQPAWTFNAGDTIVDGTVTWTYVGPFRADVGVVLKFSGGNDPTNGYVARFGTLLETDTLWCYNALIDFSTALFDPSLAYDVDMRVKKDTWFDFTADATRAGQNNHLLGYESSSSSLTYKAKGSDVFSISDAGVTSLGGVKPVVSTNTLSSIKSGTYTEGTRLWCHDCRATGQATGSGTGRWIYLDSASTWRSDDSVEAAN